MSITRRGTAPIVADLMALDPIAVAADAPLVHAARLMDSHRISGLPVVNGAGSLVGVITQTDLLRARSTEYLWANWRGLLVRHLMTRDVVTVHASTPIAIAARQMERHHVHRLIVVADDDERLPIGILSVSDLVRSISDEAEQDPRGRVNGHVRDEGRGNA